MRYPGAEPAYEAVPGFFDWLAEDPERLARVQVATDLELGRFSPAALRRYRAVFYVGHGEYYQPRTYDLLRRYRDAGGRIAFLSANSFYRQVAVPAGRYTIVLTNRLARGPQRS